jgi:hypothetical protein
MIAGSTAFAGGTRRALAPHWPAVARVGLVLAIAWLVHPMLTPVHVEGFSASIESIAMHLAGGHLADYDRLFPANLEFFALTRLGTVAFVAGLIRLGLDSEWAMRATMWAGFAALVWSSVVLVRRWTSASVGLIVAALVLIPGISESAFFYNDNVLSAALAIGALAVVGTSTRAVTTAIAGLLFGAGIVARLDAVLLAPAVALIAYERHGRVNGDFVRRALLFSAATLLPVVVVPAAVGASIFDVVRISNYAVELWDLPPSLAPHAREFAYFIGMPAALLMAFGLLRLVRERAPYRIALLAGVPLFFNLVGLGKILRSRQLLPLTPFLVALVILGVRYLLTDDIDRSRARLRLDVLVVGAAVLLGPIGKVQMSDGPRAPYGRFWSPRLWTTWQRAVRDDMNEIGRLVDTANPVGSTAVLTDHWDADRFLHLALQREGFVVEDIRRLQPPCAKAGELFRRGSANVLHLRLHQPFLPVPATFAVERLNQLALPCLAVARPARSYLLSPGAQVIPRLRSWPSLRDRVSSKSVVDAFFATGYDLMVAIPLTPQDLAPMASSFAADAAARRDSIGGAGADLARAERLMSNQVWRAGRP